MLVNVLFMITFRDRCTRQWAKYANAGARSVYGSAVVIGDILGNRVAHNSQGRLGAGDRSGRMRRDGNAAIEDVVLYRVAQDQVVGGGAGLVADQNAAGVILDLIISNSRGWVFTSLR